MYFVPDKSLAEVCNGYIGGRSEQGNGRHTARADGGRRQKHLEVRAMSVIRRNTRKGFTLVEILIVVVILGILAAIVIPQFTNASLSARENSLQSTLQTLRSQIELYKVQHGDTLPNLVTSWTAFTITSSYNGGTYGPYMQGTPVNPINALSAVSDSTTNLAGVTTTTALASDMKSPGATIGFLYDYEAGLGSGLIFGTADTTGATIAGNGTTPY
jgi:general secretion pathway protein G